MVYSPDEGVKKRQTGISLNLSEWEFVFGAMPLEESQSRPKEVVQSRCIGACIVTRRQRSPVLLLTMQPNESAF